MKRVAGDARKAIALAITSGVAALPVGSIASQAANISAGAERVIGVSVKPGATELTAICLSRSSIAMARVSPITAAFWMPHHAQSGCHPRLRATTR